VVVPAHNEEASIAFTVRSLLAADYPRDCFQVLVLADNYSDATASIAEREGALVYLRVDLVRRGKGFALEDSFKRIFNDPRFDGVEGFLVLDADSTVMPNFYKEFARKFREGSDFIQCYASVGNRDASMRTRLLTYALSLFNGVYLLGLDRAGLGAHLRGNGMGFSRSGLTRCPWQAASLAEDLEFSWRLRIRGETVRFLKETTIFAEMPSRAKDSVSQRARWEHGRGLLKKEFTKLVREAQISPGKRIAWLLDLWMPSLSVLVGLVITLASFHWAPILGTRLGFDFHIPYLSQLELSFPGLGATGLPILEFLSIGLSSLMILNLLSLTFYLLSPFWVMNLPLKYLGTFWFAPYYGLWRLGVLLRKKPQEWIRTARERETKEKSGDFKR